MPDISMCMGNDCPLKESCYRYKAEPCDYQSYFMESPYKNEKCDHYWEMEVSSKKSKKLDKKSSNMLTKSKKSKPIT
jgi:hypothetical protein